jgi:phasin
MSETFSNNTVEFPSFDPTKASEQFRAFAERGVAQSNEAYERMKSGAEWAQKTAASSAETMRAATSELSLKAIATMRANAEAGFNHLEALAHAKSFSEVIELQTSFLRAQFDTVVAQAKDIQAAATKAAEDVSRPVAQVFETAARELKAA